MKQIIKIKGICILSALAFFVSCDFKKPSDPDKSAVVTVQLKMSGEQHPGFLFDVRKDKKNDLVKKSSASSIQSDENYAIPQVIQSVDEIEIVFFDIQMTYDEFMAIYYLHEDEVDSIANDWVYNWGGDVTDFDGFWLAYYEEVLNVLTEGQYRNEKRAPLNVDGHHATGEFELAEGLKICLVGCFEQDVLTHIGESYDYATDSPVINLESGEREEVTIMLVDLSWY